MKKLFLSLILLTLNFVSFGQDSASTLFPAKKGDLWGYIDKNGTWIVPPSFDEKARYNKYGYAVVKKQGKKSVINREGTNIIPFQESEIKFINNNFIATFSGDYWYYTYSKEQINNSSKPNYTRIEEFDNSHVRVFKSTLMGIGDSNGNEIINCKYIDIKRSGSAWLCYTPTGETNIYANNGSFVQQVKFDQLSVKSDSIAFITQNNLTYAYNFYTNSIDKRGFKKMKYINNKMFLVGDKKYAIHRFGLDTLLTDSIFYNAFVFDNLGIIGQTEPWRSQFRFISLNGAMLDRTINFYEKLTNELFVATNKNLWGVVNKHGQIVQDFKYTNIGDLENNVAVVQKGGLYGLINSEGKEIIKCNKKNLEKGILSYRTKVGEETWIYHLNEEGKVTGVDKIKNFFTLSTVKYNQVNVQQRNSSFNNMFGRSRGSSDADLKAYGFKKIGRRWIMLASNGKPTGMFYNNVYLIPEKNIAITSRNTTNTPTKYGIVHLGSRKIITKPTLWNIEMEEFKSGNVARAITGYGRKCFISISGKIYYNLPVKDGKITRRQIIGHINQFSNNHAAICLDASYNKYIDYYTNQDELTARWASKWGYINNNGVLVIQPLYRFTMPVKNNNAIVGNAYKPRKRKPYQLWGVIDMSHDTILPFNFDTIYHLPESGDSTYIVSNSSVLYGFVDSTGKVICDAKYNRISKFKNGYAAVRKGRYWTYIDKSGKEISSEKLYYAGDFGPSGLAPVRSRQGWSYIDKTGRLKFEKTFSYCGEFSGGLAPVKQGGKYGYIDPNGNFVITPRYAKAKPFVGAYAFARKGKKYGIINKTGKFTTPPSFYRGYYLSEDGFALIKKRKQRLLASRRNRNKTFGVITCTGNTLVPFKYHRKVAFSYINKGFVISPSNNGRKIFNSHGKMIFKGDFKSGAIHETQSLIPVHKNGQSGYIDFEGKLKIPYQFDKAGCFSEGYAWVIKDSISGIINTSGQFKEVPHIEINRRFSNGFSRVRDAFGNEYFVDTVGNSLKIQNMEIRSSFNQGVAKVRINHNEIGFINSSGILIFEGFVKHISNYSEGTMSFSVDTQLGLYDLEGKEILPPVYDRIEYLNNGVYEVKQGNKLGYVNAKGEWIYRIE